VRGGGLPGGSYQPAGIGLNALGEVIAPRNHEIEGPWQGIFRRGASPRNYEGEFRAGRGPIYADMSWGSDEDQEYMKWSIAQEGGGWALNYMLEQYGLDYRTTKIELAPADTEHEGTAACGPMVDDHCMTNVPGLYAAGDEAGGFPWSCVPGALTMGYLAAESAVEYAKKMKAVPHGQGEEPVAAYIGDIISHKEGDPWQEAQAFIENANDFYNVQVRSETMAQRGLEYMDYLKKTMRLRASNPHEMVHCLEVRNLIECSEIIMRSTIARTESRPPILNRVDYPNKDDENWFCFLGQRSVNGKILFQKHTP
jgi:succinate dehydrogenase/fumarate reductase flavoprotein subunit